MMSVRDRLHQGWRRLVALGFRLLYHELAWAYDGVAWGVSLGQWQTWVRTALPHVEGEQVLELGHGPGHLLVALAEHGFHPVGLDPSPQMGRLAARRLARAGRQVPLVRGLAQALPFPDQSFDSVVATFPTPYIVAPETLNQVGRVLRPGGRLVVVTGARLHGRGWLVRWIEWLYAVTGQRDSPADGAHWSAALETAGLEGQARQVTLEHSTVLLWVGRRTRRREGWETRQTL